MDNRYLFRGKRLDDDEWVYGDLLTYRVLPVIFDKDHEQHECLATTIGQCTGLTAAKSYRGDGEDERLIFEGDNVVYSSYAGYKYQGIVCIGKYEQDGSGGEYETSKCYGVYVKRIKWIPLEWQDAEDEEYCLPEYECEKSLLEVDNVEIIGTIHDCDTIIDGEE